MAVGPITTNTTRLYRAGVCAVQIPGWPTPSRSPHTLTLARNSQSLSQNQTTCPVDTLRSMTIEAFKDCVYDWLAGRTAYEKDKLDKLVRQFASHHESIGWERGMRE